MAYKAIIVDDENLAREMLSDMLSIVSKEIKVVANCEDIPDAVKAINKYKPDIVFLDIDMPRYKGISIVDFFDTIDFDIIFTTAYQQYAINAIKIKAFDYLLKPIDIKELKESVDRFLEKQQQTEQEIKYKGKLLVNTSQIVHFIDIDKIIYFKAEGAYTQIICTDNNILSSKNLKFFEEYFTDNNSFLRCHKSYIVNKNQIININKVKQEITLINKAVINISLDKLDDLIS